MPGQLLEAGEIVGREKVVDAHQRDDDVIIASECVGSYDQEHQRVTLRYLDGKLARVMRNAEIRGVRRSNVPSDTAPQKNRS